MINTDRFTLIHQKRKKKERKKKKQHIQENHEITTFIILICNISRIHIKPSVDDGKY